MTESADRPLPDAFLRALDGLEAAYLRETDPRGQSGFAGGPERWRAEREPILAAVDGDGDLLDVGCANGHLLECLVAWAAERGRRLVPYGLDRGAGLVALARARNPAWADRLFTGDAWTWDPPRRFRYVYVLHDCVPASHLGPLVERLLTRAVAPGGRLVVGAYGSRSAGVAPLDVAGALTALGFAVEGCAEGGEPVMCRVAWIAGAGAPRRRGGTMAVEIRPANAADADAIGAVHARTWRASYRGIVAAEHVAGISEAEMAAGWRERLAAPPDARPTVLVATDGGAVVGFASGGPTREPALPFDAEVYALYVDPHAQRAGTGRRLLAALAGALRAEGFAAVHVRVLAANRPARVFYERLGGRYWGDAPREIGGRTYEEARYAWPAIAALAE